MAESKKIKVEFEPAELFQIHLSLISRSAFVSQMWASSVDSKQQAGFENEIKFLNDLALKVGGMLK